MAIIPSSTFKDWKDGDTVKAKEYIQELEILRTAINANGEAVAALLAATAGVLKGIQNGSSFPANPVKGDMFFRTDEEVLYILDANSQWNAISPKELVDEHIADKENPHGVTATQVGSYSKTEADNRYAVASGQRIETAPALFFTNGASTSATANVTFGKAFTEIPTVVPGSVTVSVPYIDTIGHPFITVTKTGFTVKIIADGGNLGTVGSPANAAINFLVFGK